MNGWIGVDLDGTLAYYTSWIGADHIGAPIVPMVERVKAWLAEGKDVRIFTARMHGHGLPDIATGKPVDVVGPIQRWCEQHLGRVLPVTNVKDFQMIELWDDRCVQVETNMGNATINGRLLEPVLARTHTGLRCDVRNLLRHVPVSTDASQAAYYRAALAELSQNLTELATHYYAGNAKAVDEFLQLYCLDEKRPK